MTLNSMPKYVEPFLHNKILTLLSPDPFGWMVMRLWCCTRLFGLMGYVV